MVESALAAILRAARAEWPELNVGEQDLARYLARVAPPGGSLGADALGRLATTDLVLACACASGDGAAAAVFVSRALRPAVAAAAARIGGGDRVADEAVQVLARQLLVARDDGTRGIERFAGRGSLAAWLRVAATRELIRLVRGTALDAHRGDETLLDVLTSDHDPELAIIKERYRTEVRDALKEALAGLPDRDRALLSFHFIDGLSIERVGALHSVHRSTASRWLAEARERLLDEARAALGRRLGAGGARPSDLDSLLRLIQSGIDLSLRRVLGGESEG